MVEKSIHNTLYLLEKMQNSYEYLYPTLTPPHTTHPYTQKTHAHTPLFLHTLTVLIY